MGIRRIGIAAFALLLSLPVVVRAAPPQPVMPDSDGMNCDAFSWIKADGCSSWKGFNGAASKKWWVGFSKSTGYVKTIYANRSGVVPGIQLQHITEQSARSDNATQVLLRNYARRRVRAFESELGVEPSLNDLEFGQLLTENPDTYEQGVLTSGGTAITTRAVTTPAVYLIELDQVIDKIPVADSYVMVTVDANNTLLSIDSTYSQLKPQGSSNPSLTASAAGAIAVTYSGVDPATLQVEPPAARVFWIPEQGHLALAWRVNVATATTSRLITVADRDGSILDDVNLANADVQCQVTGQQFGLHADSVGFQDGTCLAYNIHPPFQYLGGSFTANDMISSLTRYTMPEMCVWSGGDADKLNGLPIGHYVSITDGQVPMHQAPPDYVFDPSNLLDAVFRFSTNIGANANPSANPIPMNVSGPGYQFSENPELNPPDARALDEAMGYLAVDSAARFFKKHFDHELHRAVNTRPEIFTAINVDFPPVNGLNNNANAQWLPSEGIPSLCASQLLCPNWFSYIQVAPGNRLFPAADNVVASINGTPTLVDEWTPANMVLDQTIASHEFGHAMIFDRSELISTTHEYGRFHEGFADYWSATVHNDSQIGAWTLAADALVDDTKHHKCTAVAAPNQGGRELDQQIPLVAPADVLDSNPTNDPSLSDCTEIHHQGRVLAGSMWDFRKRMIQLGQEIHLLDSGPSRADTIAWGITGRIHATDGDWGAVLGLALDTDNAKFNKLFDYELLAAFARHGVTPGSNFTVAQPDHYVLDGRSLTPPDLHLTAYIANRINFLAEFTTNPEVFCQFTLGTCADNVARQADPTSAGFNYLAISSSDNNAPPVTGIPHFSDPTGGDLYGTEDQVIFTVPNATLEQFAAGIGRTSVPIWMRVTTFDLSTSVPTPSHIDGAGRLFEGVDDLGTFYISSGAAAGCSCNIVRGARGARSVPLLALLFCGAMFAARRTFKKE